MAWIRLSDDYNDHPKFAHLSDGAFRLWHQAMGFCRKYQTDGLVPVKSLRDFKAYSPKRARELMTPWRADANPLWIEVTGFGVKVHDYLDWNPSKEETNERRAESRDHMRQLRSERRKQSGIPPPVSTNTVLTATPTSPPTIRDVTGMGKELDLPGKGCGENPSESALLERAGRLRQELYPAWYAKHRHGAKLRLIENYQDFQDALSLVRTWDDARLEKLARIILTTNEDFIARTDRGFHIFAIKASWADDRLRQEEHRSA